jgi:hypothetical protein
MRGIGAGLPQGGQPSMQQQQPGGHPEPDSDEAGRGAPSDGDGDERGEQQASPEEQAAYDKFVNNALEVIYPANAQGQMSPAIVSHLQGKFEPQLQQLFAQADPPLDTSKTVDNIGATACLVAMALDASAQQAGHQVPDEIMYHGGAEIVQVLANDGEHFAGFQIDDQGVEQSFYRAVDLFRQLSPRVDQNQLADEFAKLNQADKEGRLGKVLPGLPGGAPMQGGQAQGSMQPQGGPPQAGQVQQ